MDFKINKDSGKEAHDKQQDAPAEKKSQTPQLLLLLLLIAGFGYVYFFTGLIKPLPEPKTEIQPPPQVVKKALPPREAAAPAATAPVVVQPGDKATAEAPQSPAKPSSKASPAEVGQKTTASPTPGASVPPAATAQPSVKPVADASKVKKDSQVSEEKQKLPEKKAAPVTAAQKKESTAVSGKKDQNVVVKKQEPEKKPAVTVKAEKPVAKKQKAVPQAVAGENWTLLVGNYLLESEMATDMARIRKAGLEPSIIPGAKIKAKMNRLFSGEYGERAAAQSELDKLKRLTADAFILEQGGKFAVYAGSYLLAERVEEERERLAKAGFSLAVKKVEVTLPSKGLTAGSYCDKKSAEAARSKLIAAGLDKVTPVRL